MVAAGICHTDLVCRDGFPVPMPIVLGHEGAGVVESVGRGVKTLAVGDHVLLSFNACGACANCASHEPAYCHHFLGLNFGGLGRPDDNSSPLSQDGAKVHGNFFGQSSFAALANVRERNAVKIDRALPLELLAPLGCGVQTGAGAVLNSLKVRAGRSVAVFGCGAVGLSAVMAAKVAGARAIVAVEPNAARRELALSLGATAALDPKGAGDIVAALREASGGGLDYAIDTSGIPAVAKTAVDAMLPGGIVGLIGIPPPDAPMPFGIMDLYMRGLGLKCIVEGDADPQTFIPRLVQMYQAGQLPIERLVKTFPFEQINEAMTAGGNGSVIKPIVLFP
jgi:aryl-alcohol dehydrogenase/geraniol dehydrogenase (NAD+)